MGCEGCKTKIDFRDYTIIDKCIIKNNAPKRKCPCQPCVIKPMCNVQCKQFNDLVVSIFKIETSYDYKGLLKEPKSYNGNPVARPYYNRRTIGG